MSTAAIVKLESGSPATAVEPCGTHPAREERHVPAHPDLETQHERISRNRRQSDEVRAREHGTSLALPHTLPSCQSNLAAYGTVKPA